MTFTLDLSGVKTKEELHDLLQKVLPLPDYYGRNLDALFDVLICISEPMEIRFQNTIVAENYIGDYLYSLFRLCEDLQAENHLFTFSIIDNGGFTQAL